MEIRSDGSIDSVRLNQTADGADSARAKRFVLEKRLDLSAENRVPQSATFRSIATKYRKADLNNSARLNELISDTVNQLIENEFPDLKTSDSHVVGDWLRKDPLLQERIIRCFERMLA